MRTAVVTIAAGRLTHLESQFLGLTHGSAPDAYVVVSMGDQDVVAATARFAATTSLSVQSVVQDGSLGLGLPLAAARNAGAGAAVDAGCDLIVFLDVDCIPSRDLVARYRAAAGRPEIAEHAPAVLAGQVWYLPPLGSSDRYDLAALARLGQAHPGRPVLRTGGVTRAGDLNLFWSLSFAVTASDWLRLGGFHEGYRGYGGEDTDFAQVLAAAGGSMWWVGGADAYHQHHQSPSPPTQHLESIIRNANLFRERWGWFPMPGWLAEFDRLGLARLDLTAGRWVVSS